MEVTAKICETLGNWVEVMQPLIEEKDGPWERLYSYLKTQVKDQGKIVIPKSAVVWKSLRMVDRHKVKCIILLEGPYATMRDNVQISNGIPLDSSNVTPYTQSALHHWYQAIEQQYGFCPTNDLRDNIEYLLTEEHVLLLHIEGTVEKDKPGSHAAIWEPIIKWLIERVINQYTRGLPIILVGKASKYEQYIIPMTHHVLKVESMDNATNGNRNWKHGNLHKFCNDIIEKSNGKSEIIQWTRSLKPKEPENVALKDWLGTAYEEGIENAKPEKSEYPWDDN